MDEQLAQYYQVYVARLKDATTAAELARKRGDKKTFKKVGVVYSSELN